MLASFSSAPKTVAIKSVTGGSITLAQTLPLAMFNQAKLVRPLRAGASSKQVLMPIQGSVAQLIKPTQDSNVIEIRGALKSSDLILLGSVDANNKSLKPCDATRQRQFLPDVLKHPSLADEIVSNTVSVKAKGYNLFETNTAYLDSVELALRDGFFASAEISKTVDSPFCIVVQEVQQLPKSECTSGRCSGTGSVASGVRIYEGAAKVSESIIGARFDFTEIKFDSLSQFIGLKAYEHQVNSISQHQSKLN